MIKALIELVSNNTSKTLIDVITWLDNPSNAATLNHRVRRKHAAAYAAEKGYRDTFVYLTDQPTTKFELDDNEFSLPFWAAQHQSLDILEYILDKKNGLLDKLHDGTTDIHIAAFYGDLDTIKARVHNDESCLHHVDKNGHTALFYAVVANRQNVINYFKQYTDRIDCENKTQHEDSSRRGKGFRLWHDLQHEQDHDLALAIDYGEQALDLFETLQHKNEHDYTYLARFCERILAFLSYQNNFDDAQSYLSLFQTYFEQIQEIHATYQEDYTEEEMDMLKAIEDHKEKLFNAINDEEDDDDYDDDYPIKLNLSEYQLIKFTLLGDEYQKTIEQREVPDPAHQRTQKMLALAEARATAYGFTRVNVDGDGSCFFHAVYQQISSLPLFSWVTSSLDLRFKALAHIQTFDTLYRPFFSEEESFEGYIEAAKSSTYWADDYLKNAVSRILHVNLVVLSTHTPEPLIIKQSQAVTTIYLMNIDNQHFQSLYKTPSIVPEHDIQHALDEAVYDNEFRPTKLDYLTTALQDTLLQNQTKPDLFSTLRLPSLRNPDTMSEPSSPHDSQTKTNSMTLDDDWDNTSNSPLDDLVNALQTSMQNNAFSTSMIFKALSPTYEGSRKRKFDLDLSYAPSQKRQQQTTPTATSITQDNQQNSRTIAPDLASRLIGVLEQRIDEDNAPMMEMLDSPAFKF